MRGEFEINDIGETLLHESRDDFAEGRRLEVLPFLGNILAPGDGADGRGICARTADALFLHGADERRFRITRRRLGEALLLVELFERYDLALGKIGQRLFPAGLLVLVRVLIHCSIPRETKRGMICLEAVSGAESIDHHVIIDGVCHLARRKRPQIRRYRRYCSAVRSFFTRSGVRFTLLGRMASCASCAPALVL